MTITLLSAEQVQVGDTVVDKSGESLTVVHIESEPLGKTLYLKGSSEKALFVGDADPVTVEL